MLYQTSMFIMQENNTLESVKKVPMKTGPYLYGGLRKTTLTRLTYKCSGLYLVFKNDEYLLI